MKIPRRSDFPRNDILKRVTLLALLPAWFLIGCGANFGSRNAVTSEVVQPVGFATSTPSASSTVPIANTFIEPERFAATAKLETWKHDGMPVAGVVNHHSLAMDLIAKFFKTLKTVRPGVKTFIILSPDHFARGQDVSSSRLDYSTPDGKLEVKFKEEGRKTDATPSSCFLLPYSTPDFCCWDGTDSRAFEKEHGVGALAPFIKHEFPDAKIMPIFISRTAPRQRLEELGRTLASLADEDTFLVVSSDMSHYLRRVDAEVRDRETIQWLARGDWPLLESATDKNSDSASGFTVLHEYLKARIHLTKGNEKGIGDFKMLTHAISTDYSHDAANTTSYIVGFWE